MSAKPSHWMSRSDPTQAFWRDPALPFVESRRACQSRACYKPHHHPTFSIGAVDGGRSVFTGTEAGPVTLSPGTLVFVPAERVHACNPAPDTAWSYQMQHLDADWLRAVRQEYADTASMAPEPVRIVSDKATYACFCQLNALLFSQAEPGDKEASLIEFIGDFDTEQGLHIEVPSIPSRLTEHIRPALDCLRANPSASIALDELARLAGMSRYQTIRAFRAVTGMTPHAWQLNQRINLAKHQLRDGGGIAAVAQHLGFADQAHFHRVFKAHTGGTPGCFRT
ncbi:MULTISPECIES: AraC family transcriptional regulator [Klebsiella]|uniref:AraC family transcriptional regulator n=1 Tax=Klebsiella TaxID=570 RepID=UPI0004E393FC|nr:MULTISPECIES: AraC family transcriptional regulator [Klebsiella]KFC38162.1 AraC family transcriptional regulator [Klebsiella michiganensis]MBA6167379.1 helix-turn-helix transcriptional regulator [Klebsiella variicola]MBA6183073.1 helix-turn-helix transcriptional regulator [Klebsiella variicola]UWX16768.1 AraC family transcriptional regulator [Klebsiella pneumoniae]UWX22160.1 AraC family transcriptional regulator [Klebsiella pneumoniae]